MRKTAIIFAVVTMLAGLRIPSVMGQGELTPPGAPGKTMKTLGQVEPRIPIDVGRRIDEPGSYYLTGNLTSTVTIAVNDVSLDLMGFAINVSSGSAIDQVSPLKGVRIHNGVLSAPFGNGIDFSISEDDANGKIENLRVSDCKNFGVVVGSGFDVLNVQVQKCRYSGIGVYGNSRVRDCTVTGCNNGIHLLDTGALIENNRVFDNENNYNLTPGNKINILLCEVPESLDWPCSVKFAGTLSCSRSNGITVNAGSVTIDLDGHALIGAGSSGGSGIYQAGGVPGVTVRNGSIVGWGGVYGRGIHAGTGSRISGINVISNTVGILVSSACALNDCTAYENAESGIYASGGDCSIRNCRVYHNGGHGIFAYTGAVVSDCAAYNNGTNGIDVLYGSVITGCSAYYNDVDGIHTISGSTISDCAAYENDSDGIRADYGSVIRGCATQFNQGDGIEVDSECLVVGNICFANGEDGDGAGIHVLNSGNRIEDNNVKNSDRGIDVDAAGNIIVRNTVGGNTNNWDVVAGNACLVIKASTGGAISGDSGGAGLGSTNPNTNFTF